MGKVKQNDLAELRIAFLEAFFAEKEAFHQQATAIVRRKLDFYSNGEAADPITLAQESLAEIQLTIAKQLVLPLSTNGQNKIKSWNGNKGYIRMYLIRGLYYYCSKKRERWSHNVNWKKERESGQKLIKKASIVARTFKSKHDLRSDDEWMVEDSSALQQQLDYSDVFKAQFTKFLVKKKLKPIEIECFWHRAEGVSYPDMAEIYGKCRTKKDTYRKRYIRLLVKLNLTKDKLNKMLGVESN